MAVTTTTTTVTSSSARGTTTTTATTTESTPTPTKAAVTVTSVDNKNACLQTGKTSFDALHHSWVIDLPYEKVVSSPIFSFAGLNSLAPIKPILASYECTGYRVGDTRVSLLPSAISER